MFLCQMSGIPGTGKSSLARQICKKTNSVLLDLDVIKSSVLNSFENDIDFKFAGKISYDIIFSLANSNLEIGNNVVIDSPCGYDFIIERGINLIKRYSISYKFIECYLDDLTELNRRRIVREILPSQKYNTPISLEEYKISMNNLKRPSDYEYLLIDTSKKTEKYIDVVFEYLSK